MSAGKVINRAGLELPHHHYDVVVIGGGVLGLASAFYLKQSQPALEILVAEQDGIPSEMGATFVSPALLLPDSDDPNDDLTQTLSILRNLSEETGVNRPYDIPYFPTGAVDFLQNATDSSIPTLDWLANLKAPQQKAIGAMLNLDAFPFVHVSDGAGYGSAEAIAQHYGYGAVKLGVDLLLNGRVVPRGSGALELERLEFNNKMQRHIAKRERITAEQVIVAAGASTPQLVEDAVGVVTPLKRVYRQYPRIEKDARLPLKDARVNLPILQAHGFYFRPQGEGVLVVPPPLQADPNGYEPVGGNLMGVRVGLRREILEQLMEATEAIPALAWESLNLGKTVQHVRGAWDVVTRQGDPAWQQVDENWFTLVGGVSGLGKGLLGAKALAKTVAKL